MFFYGTSLSCYLCGFLADKARDRGEEERRNKDRHMSQKRKNLSKGRGSSPKRRK